MAIAWPSGIPTAFVQDTYERTPEDVVKRTEVAVGPPLRFLWAASRAQAVVGELILTDAQHELFEIWRKTDLDYGKEAFDLTLYDHPASRVVEARLRGAPALTARSGKGRRLRLEMRVDPPAPSPATLSALAALHKAAPAAWPGTVPGCPRVANYEKSAVSQVARSDDRNSPGAVLVSRLEGSQESVSLTLNSTQLLAFEAWFEGTAALGVRDILFPVPGGTHTGCFTSGYSVRGAGDIAAWAVTFNRYLEARP